MAYQNSPVSDGIGVVQAITSFAGAHGWTVHRDEGDGTYRTTTLSAGGAYITLHGVQNSVFLNGHRGIDTGAAWDAQPDQYYNSGDNESRTEVKFRVNPLLSVHLFASATPTPHVYAAIENEPGYYRHIVIGHMQKFGAALGGLFWDVADTDWGRYSSGRVEMIRYPLVYKTLDDYPPRDGGLDCQDTLGNPQWASFCPNTVYPACGMWANEMTRHIGTLSAIDFNGRTPLQTPFVEISTNDVYVPYGTPPNLRYVSMEFFEAGDEMTIGPDTWKVFPVIRRGPAKGYMNPPSEPSDEFSENYGIAYLKS